jgi:tetratricopeptide (TPR) repeat protein
MSVDSAEVPRELEDLLHHRKTNYRPISFSHNEEEKIEVQADLARSITLCQQLLDKAPRLYDVLYHLALAQLGSGQPDEALATYRQALEVCSARGVVQEAIQILQLLLHV